MKLIMLMVLFSTASDPKPHAAHGYGPRPMKDMETCLQRRSRMQSYLEANAQGAAFSVFCVEFQAQGYAEAVDAFQRQIGEPL